MDRGPYIHQLIWWLQNMNEWQACHESSAVICPVLQSYITVEPRFTSSLLLSRTILFSALFWFFWLHRTTCRILVPWQGIECDWATAVKVRSSNHWTARGFPTFNQTLLPIWQRVMPQRQCAWNSLETSGCMGSLCCTGKYFFSFYFILVQLAYNVLLISAVQQSNSAIHIQNGLVFLLLNFKSSLCILDNSPLSDASFENSFCWSVPCPLYSFYIIFHRAEVFNFCGTLENVEVWSHLTQLSSHETTYHWLQPIQRGFPGGSDGKESACNAGDSGSIPGLGRSPGGGNGNPL